MNGAGLLLGALPALPDGRNAAGLKTAKLFLNGVDIYSRQNIVDLGAGRDEQPCMLLFMRGTLRSGGEALGE
jgi:hypothetical protein